VSVKLSSVVVVTFALLMAIPLALLFPITSVATVDPSGPVDVRSIIGAAVVRSTVIAAAAVIGRVGIVMVLRTSNTGD